MRKYLLLCVLPCLLSCWNNEHAFRTDNIPEKDTTVRQINVYKTSDETNRPITTDTINTGKTRPAELIAFAQSLKGIPYQYASSDPARGFDCSGFITYVFNHFGIAVPRSSVDFTTQGHPVALRLAKPGDLILFTGTDSTIRTVGHMGIITRSGDSTVFIHSTSGKAYGVTETPLNGYYEGRFVKAIRIFRGL